VKMPGHSRKIRYSVCIVFFASLVPLVCRGTDTSKPLSLDTVGSNATHNIPTASSFVVIDRREPAFIVFTGIPKTLEQKKIDEIRLKVSSNETSTMLSWQEFMVRVDEYARSIMLRNDYPNTRSVDGIVCLVASQQGTGAPWGLTWNGGIALTFNDYQHARRSYQSYKENPAAYEAIRDPRRDPVDRGGHLPFGGCG